MGYICSKSKFQCLHVCKHWNLDFEEMYPNARFFLTPTNKWLSRSLFCANKNFCLNFVCVCFVCAVCVLLQFRVIKYCARQISKVVLSVLRRKKNVFYLSPRKKLDERFKTSSSFPEILAEILNFPFPGKIPAGKSRKYWRES